MAGVSIPGPPGFVFTSAQLVMMPKARDAMGVASSVCLSIYLCVLVSLSNKANTGKYFCMCIIIAKLGYVELGGWWLRARVSEVCA